MNNNIIVQDIINEMKFEPTNSQIKAIYKFANFISSESYEEIFLLKGYAGTGKTTLIRSFIKILDKIGINVILLASTGRAAKTLENTTSRKASTIHRLIYSAENYDDVNNSAYNIASNNLINTLFIVDEASMITTNESFEMSVFGSGNLLDDLMSFVYSSEKCKLMLVGDTAQLPPVGSSISNALSKEYLSDYYSMKVYASTLNDVVRQKNSSGILNNATMLRKMIFDARDMDEDEVFDLKLELDNFRDIKAIKGEEIIDYIDDAYRNIGIENCLVVCLSNKTAYQYNIGIRNRILDYEEPIVRGERLIVNRNNYHYTKRKDRSDFIANGEMIELSRISKYHDVYDLDFIDGEIYLPDRDIEKEVCILTTALSDEKAQRSSAERQELYKKIEEDYMDIVSVRARNKKVRQDKFWGALEVKYGYAVTAHKAQGGQWHTVFIDMSHLSYFPIDKNMLRWIYTAITRATNKVYLINLPSFIYNYDN